MVRRHEAFLRWEVQVAQEEIRKSLGSSCRRQGWFGVGEKQKGNSLGISKDSQRKAGGPERRLLTVKTTKWWAVGHGGCENSRELSMSSAINLQKQEKNGEGSWKQTAVLHLDKRRTDATKNKISSSKENCRICTAKKQKAASPKVPFFFLEVF